MFYVDLNSLLNNTSTNMGKRVLVFYDTSCQKSI
jgi:hypothetical protein